MCKITFLFNILKSDMKVIVNVQFYEINTKVF